MLLTPTLLLMSCATAQLSSSANTSFVADANTVTVAPLSQEGSGSNAVPEVSETELPSQTEGFDSATDAPFKLLVPARPKFRSKGDLYLSGATSSRLAGTYTSSGDASQSAIELQIGTQIGYFVSKSFAVGGAINLDVAAGSGTTQAAFAIGPVLTGRLPVGKQSAFMPALGLLYTAAGAALPSGVSNSTHLLVFDLQFLFAIPLMHRVMVTVGPYLAPNVGTATNNDGATGSISGVDYGIRVGLLAWKESRRKH